MVLIIRIFDALSDDATVSMPIAGGFRANAHFQALSVEALDARDSMPFTHRLPNPLAFQWTIWVEPRLSIRPGNDRMMSIYARRAALRGGMKPAGGAFPPALLANRHRYWLVARTQIRCA
jgi:hypothetical protein